MTALLSCEIELKMTPPVHVCAVQADSQITAHHQQFHFYEQCISMHLQITSVYNLTKITKKKCKKWTVQTAVLHALQHVNNLYASKWQTRINAKSKCSKNRILCYYTVKGTHQSCPSSTNQLSIFLYDYSPPWILIKFNYDVFKLVFPTIILFTHKQNLISHTDRSMLRLHDYTNVWQNVHK